MLQRGGLDKRNSHLSVLRIAAPAGGCHLQLQLAHHSGQGSHVLTHVGSVNHSPPPIARGAIHTRFLPPLSKASVDTCKESGALSEIVCLLIWHARLLLQSAIRYSCRKPRTLAMKATPRSARARPNIG